MRQPAAYSPRGDTLDAIKAHLRSLCCRHPNVRLLDNETWVIGDVMLIGSTLWVSV